MTELLKKVKVIQKPPKVLRSQSQSHKQNHEQTLSLRAVCKKWYGTVAEAQELQNIQQNTVNEENLKSKLYAPLEETKILQNLRTKIDEILKNDPEDPLFGHTAEDPNPIVQADGEIEIQDLIIDRNLVGGPEFGPLEEKLGTIDDLEMMNVAFDGVVQQLGQLERQPQLQSILDTLTQLKNYYVNKIYSKSTLEKAVCAATQQMDRRCQALARECDELHAQSRQLREQLDATSCQKGDLEQKLLQQVEVYQNTRQQSINQQKMMHDYLQRIEQLTQERDRAAQAMDHFKVRNKMASDVVIKVREHLRNALREKNEAIEEAETLENERVNLKVQIADLMEKVRSQKVIIQQLKEKEEEYASKISMNQINSSAEDAKSAGDITIGQLFSGDGPNAYVRNAMNALIKLSNEEFQEQLSTLIGTDVTDVQALRLIMQKIYYAKNHDELTAAVHPEKQKVSTDSIGVQVENSTYQHLLNDYNILTQRLQAQQKAYEDVRQQLKIIAQSPRHRQPVTKQAADVQQHGMTRERTVFCPAPISYQTNNDIITLLFGSRDDQISTSKFEAMPQSYHVKQMIEAVNMVNEWLPRIPKGLQHRVKLCICSNAANKVLPSRLRRLCEINPKQMHEKILQKLIEEVTTDANQNNIDHSTLAQLRQLTDDYSCYYQAEDDATFEDGAQQQNATSAPVQRRGPRLYAGQNAGKVVCGAKSTFVYGAAHADTQPLPSEGFEKRDLLSLLAGPKGAKGGSVRPQDGAPKGGKHSVKKKQHGKSTVEEQHSTPQDMSRNGQPTLVSAQRHAENIRNTSNSVDGGAVGATTVSAPVARSIGIQVNAGHDVTREQRKTDGMATMSSTASGERRKSEPVRTEQRTMSVGIPKQPQYDDHVSSIVNDHAESQKVTEETQSSTMQLESSNPTVIHEVSLTSGHITDNKREEGAVGKPMSACVSRDAPEVRQPQAPIYKLTSISYIERPTDQQMLENSLNQLQQILEKDQLYEQLVGEQTAYKEYRDYGINTDQFLGTDTTGMQTDEFQGDLVQQDLIIKDVAEIFRDQGIDTATFDPRVVLSAPGEPPRLDVCIRDVLQQEVSRDASPAARAVQTDSEEIILQKLRRRLMAAPATGSYASPVQQDTAQTRDGGKQNAMQKRQTALPGVLQEGTPEEIRVRNQSLFDLQRVATDVKPSYINYHPKVGPVGPQHYDFGVPQIQQFVLVHYKDNIILRYCPDRFEDISYFCPCVLRQFSVRQYKQLNSATRQEFVALYSDPNQRPTGTTLLPVAQSKVQSVRLGSLQLTISPGTHPLLFKLVSKTFGHQVKTVQFNGQPYISIPFQNITMRSLSWTVKIIRQIMNSRVSQSCSFIKLLVENQSDLNVAQTFDYEVFQNTLDKLQFDNLAGYTIFYIQTKYGQTSLCLQLIYSLIINIAYYQYENQEVYLFTRLLMGDLDDDYFLLYCEMRRILGLDGMSVEYVNIDVIRTLVQTIFPNWNAKRIGLFCQQVYATLYAKIPRDRTELMCAIEFSELAQLLLFSFGVYRAQVYKEFDLLYHYLLKDQQLQGPATPAEGLTEGSFKQLFSALLPQWPSSSIYEFFYYHKQLVKVNDSYQQLVKLHDLQNIFVSNQLGRFIEINTGLLNKIIDLDCKKLTMRLCTLLGQVQPIISQVTMYLSNQRNKQLIQSGGKFKERIEQRFMSTIEKIKIINQQAQQDTLVYDVGNCIMNFQKLISIFITELADIKQELCIVIVSGALSALGQFLRIIDKSCDNVHG